MSTHVALLRGINVGGKNLIRMSALKDAFEADGFGDVRTYIQSGNALFQWPGEGSTVLANRIEAMLESTFGIPLVVVVRSRPQMPSRTGHPRGSAPRRRRTGTTSSS